MEANKENSRWKVKSRIPLPIPQKTLPTIANRNVPKKNETSIVEKRPDKTLRTRQTNVLPSTSKGNQENIAKKRSKVIGHKIGLKNVTKRKRKSLPIKEEPFLDSKDNKDHENSVIIISDDDDVDKNCEEETRFDGGTQWLGTVLTMFLGITAVFIFQVIIKKGFQSIASLGLAIYKMMIERKAEADVSPDVSPDHPSDQIHKLKEENRILIEKLNSMMLKFEELEGKHRCPPPPALPLVPPPPPPPCNNILHEIAHAHAPWPKITPEDLASVKLRKVTNNPVRAKSTSQKPLVTPQMLQSAQAKLQRTQPVAASTAKQ